MSTIKPVKPANVPTGTISIKSTRDAMLNDIMASVRFNRFDLKFLSNIRNKYISTGTSLSHKQNDLFEKLMHKYRKQLRKLKVDYREIITAPWVHGVVSQEKLNQQTFLKLVEQENNIEMQLYFNFNKKQIEEIRKLVHDDIGSHLNRGDIESFGNGRKYDFTWDNQTKIWRGQFNLYLFKELVFWAKKNGVVVDKTAEDVVSKIKDYGTQAQWTPQIKIVHGRMYISHYTESMEPFVKDIDFTNTSIQNIERLVKLGLRAPNDVGDIAQYVNSASGNEVLEIHTANDIDTLKQYIDESGRKCVLYTSYWSSHQRDDILKDLDIIEWDNNIVRFDSQDNDGKFNIDRLVKEGYNTLITTEPTNVLFQSQREVGKFALLADKVIYISITGKM